MPRWKALVQLMGGAAFTIVGAVGADAAMDMYPFVIRDWVTTILCVLVIGYGWHLMKEAWRWL